MTPNHRPLIAAATRTLKRVNQDAAATMQHLTLPLATVAIADGLGSHFGAEFAARVAAEATTATAAHLTALDDVDIDDLFARARDSIGQAVADREIPADLDLSASFGTTLLCAVDRPDSFAVGYVGNGAIIHLRGDFDTFPSTQLLPWNAVNYLNPHSRMVRGTNVMYKWLGPRTTIGQSTPTVVEIAKDNLLFGDLLVVCTDGIASLDQARHGLDPDQRLWTEAEPSVMTLYEHLRGFLRQPVLTSDALAACIESCLGDIETRGRMADDCTIGVIVSSAAQDYYCERQRMSEGIAL